jgi:hypothetical protein
MPELKLRSAKTQGVVLHHRHGLQEKFGSVFFRIEQITTIKKQHRLTFRPDGFNRLCAPGQTARRLILSGGAWRNVPPDRTGVKDSGAMAFSSRGRGRPERAEKRNHRQNKDPL